MEIHASPQEIHGVVRRGGVRYTRATLAGCRSSVVEHSLGKGEVDSSILSGSTSFIKELEWFLGGA